MPPYSNNDNKIEPLENFDKEKPLECIQQSQQICQNDQPTEIIVPRISPQIKMPIDGNANGGELLRENGLSYMATLLNLLKSMVGAGYLSLPLAFANAGLWTTLFLLVLLASLNGFCMSQLVKAAQHHYKRLGINFLNYGELAKVTCANSFQWVCPYGNLAKYIINANILLYQFGVCSAFYLFVAVSLKEISEELTPFRASILQWLMLIYIPMCLLNFVRTLRILAFLSTIGNFFMIFTLIFILQYVIGHPKHSIHDLPWFNSFDGLLTASGAIIFTFEAQTLILPMENKLRRPSQMLGPFGVLSSGLSLACLVYSTIGFFGYIAYGNEVKGSITLNLPQHQVSFTLVKLAICVSVFGSFLLQMYVIVEMVWNSILGQKWAAKSANEKEGNKNREERSDEDSEGMASSICRIIPNKLLCIELIFRTLMVTVCFLFAAAVPNLERIIPLIGITTGMLISFVWPAILDLLNFVPILMGQGRHFQAKCRIVQNLLLACVGLFGMFAGLKANIKEMLADSHSVINNAHSSQLNATFY